MQITCTSLQTDNHANISSLIFYRRMLFLTPNQQRKTTQGNTPERKDKINALELERWWDLLRLTV